MLGGDGLTHSSKIAMLSANYAMARLSGHYKVKFTNENERCAHEFIIDLAEFDASAGLKVMDFAKRLQDFGIHPPTCSWPLTTAMLVSASLSSLSFANFLTLFLLRSNPLNPKVLEILISTLSLLTGLTTVY